MKCNHNDCFTCPYPDCMASKKGERGMNSINSEFGRNNKEVFEKLVKSAGYDNIRQFCIDAGIDQSNLYSNLTGKFKMNIRRIFKIANTLGVPFLQIVDIFYHEELEENQSLL